MSEQSKQTSSGPTKRRRSNNRNRNHQNGGERQGGQQRNRRSNNGRRGPRKPAPLEMTFWLKVKKFFGLLDEEKERAKQNAKRRANQKPGTPRENQTSSTQPQRSPKSNVRNAKTSTDTKPKPRPSVLNSRLYLGNLSFEATEYELEDLFKGIGNVKKVEIIYNRATHRSKGYGFVEMYNIDDAKRAVEVLHDQPFMGRNLVVSGAKERQDNADRSPRKKRHDNENQNKGASATAQPAAQPEEVTFSSAEDSKESES